MRKILFLLVLSMFYLNFALPAKAILNAEEEELVYRGFSQYMVELVDLQQSRHEHNFKYSPPSRGETLMKNLLDNDIVIPAQDFGWYEIKNKTFD
jgi:hypothetical protein